MTSSLAADGSHKEGVAPTVVEHEAVVEMDEPSVALGVDEGGGRPIPIRITFIDWVYSRSIPLID